VAHFEFELFVLKW